MSELWLYDEENLLWHEFELERGVLQSSTMTKPSIPAIGKLFHNGSIKFNDTYSTILGSRLEVWRTGVVSSNVKAVGYDIDLHILDIEFHKGNIYRYFGVALAEYEEFVAAESIGKHFNKHIRGKFSHMKLDGGS